MVKVYDVCNKPNIKFDIDKRYVYVTTSITYIPEGFTQLVDNNKSYEFIEAVKLGKNVIISQKCSVICQKNQLNIYMIIT